MRTRYFSGLGGGGKADEKQLLDSIEDEVKQGGYIIDWHACDLFPKSWIDLVVVLRVDSTLLYDRLKARYVCHHFSAEKRRHY